MYPGNHTESEILSVPRNLKTRPGAPETHLAYITHDEGELLKNHKPGTPHKGPHDIPNYDSWDWMSSSSSGSESSSGSGPHGNGGGNYFDPWVDNYSTPTADNRPNPIYVPTPEESNWAGEFANTPTVIQESEDDYYEDDGYWDAPVGTDPPINYVPWQTSPVDNFVSAYGGLSYDWVDPNSAFLTEDIWGNPLPDHGEHWYEGGGLWNPFYAGEDPQGNPIWLNEGQFNEMMSVGEFGILPPGGSTGGPGPGGGGGWGGGRGGGRGSGMGGGTPKYGGDFAGENPWGLSQIQRAWINQLRGMNRGGIVNLC